MAVGRIIGNDRGTEGVMRPGFSPQGKILLVLHMQVKL